MRFALTAICAAICLLPTARADDSEMLYAVRFRNGDVVRGKKLDGVMFVHGAKDVKLDGTHILSPDKPVAEIRHLQPDTKAGGAYVAFTNGDRLPAKLARALPSPHKAFELAVTLPLKAKSGSMITVDRESIVRVSGADNNQAWRGDGTIWLTDGQEIKARSIRWQADSFRALTAKGIVTMPLGKIQEWQPKRQLGDTTADLLYPQSAPAGGRMVRFEMTNGATLTCPEYRVQKDGDDLLVQPPWALTAIELDKDDIVAVSYWAANELPVSALPINETEQKSFSGFTWNWQKDRSIRGGDLRSGSVIGAHGFSTHSFSILTVSLPPGAETFSSWVGLDHLVGDGGCVTCTVYADSRDGKKLWESGFIRGSDKPQRIDKLSVKGLKKLVFVTDFGHDGRPEGADPFDVRDEVNWIEPLLTVSAVPAHTDAQKNALKRAPLLRGWVSESEQARVRPVEIWNQSRGAWEYGLRFAPAVGGVADGKAAPLEVPAAPGIRVKYYEGFKGNALPNFSKMQPTKEAVVKQVDLNIPGRRDEYFAAQFEGLLLVPQDGQYEFWLGSDDGSRMFLNDILMINNDGDHAYVDVHRKVRLRAGAVRLRVEYYQGQSVADLQLAWQGPDFARQHVPTSALHAKDDVPVQKVTAAFMKSVSLKADGALVLSKRVRVGPSNSRFVLEAAPAKGGSGGFQFKVAVNGEPLTSFLNGDVRTDNHSDYHRDTKVYGLGKYFGEDVQLQIFINPAGAKSWEEIRPLLLSRLELGPLIANAPARGPHKPEVPLASLLPRLVKWPGDRPLQAGKSLDGKPLRLRDIVFADGFGVPAGSVLEYELQPEWRRFVAVVGMGHEGWQDIGPFEVYLDGTLHWKSKAKFGRTTAPMQVDVGIPPGHKKIRLQLAPGESHGGWANAGFMLQ
jgi:hypothetical protein